MGSAFGLALDESLCALRPESADLSGAHALILKPALLGGVSGCVAWARCAARFGAHAVLSHTFDGPLGQALSATLALAFGSEHLAHGLDVPDGSLQPWPEPGFGLPELTP